MGLVEVWHIVADPSGHHRALSVPWIEKQGLQEGERSVGEARSYHEACREADRLNSVAEVMES